MSKPSIIQPGYRSNMLTVLSSHAVIDDKGRDVWMCSVRCDCGNRRDIRRCQLYPGSRTYSCGCLTSKYRSENAKTHGESATPIYNIWRGMIKRCETPTHKAYENYGGRGIKVCKRWRQSYEAFRDDMGMRPRGSSLERRNNDSGYKPSNCYWATPKEQSNNRRDNVVLELHGESMTAAQWAEKIGLAPHLIYARTRRGWPVEKVLTTPVDSRFSRVLA